MAKKATEFLNSLLSKVGLRPEDEVVKMLMTVTALNDIEIPDLVTNAIQNNLLSINDAKNNHPEIKNHYTSQAYDGLDKEINRFAEDFKLPDEVKAELLAEKSSVKRSTLLAAKVKSLEEAKATSGKGEKDTLQAEINRLNNELRAEKDKEGALKAEHQKEIKAVRMSHSLGGLLGGYKTKFDDLPAGVKESALKATIDNSLATDAAEITVDDSGQLVLRKKDGTNFFGEDNRLLDPKSYLDKIFARDKILITTDQNQNQNNGSGSGANNSHNRNNGQNYQRQQNQNNGSGNNGNGNGQAANTVLSGLVAESLKALDSNKQ